MGKIAPAGIGEPERGEANPVAFLELNERSALRARRRGHGAGDQQRAKE